MDAPSNGATGRSVQRWNDATSNSAHGQDLDYPGKKGAMASLIENLEGRSWPAQRSHMVRARSAADEKVREWIPSRAAASVLLALSSTNNVCSGAAPMISRARSKILGSGLTTPRRHAVEAVSKETGPAEAVDPIRLRMGRVGEKGKPGASAGRCEQDPQGVGVEVEPAPNVGVDQVSQQRLVGRQRPVEDR